MNLIRNGYPAMWASFYETFFSFYLYDEMRDFSWFFINYADYWKGAVRIFNAGFAAFVGTSLAFLHDKYLRDLVEKR